MLKVNKLGERIKLASGTTVEVVPGESCKGCYFHGPNQYENGPADDCNDDYKEVGSCHQDFRSDHTSVIFTLVKEEQNET